MLHIVFLLGDHNINLRNPLESPAIEQLYNIDQIFHKHLLKGIQSNVFIFSYVQVDIFVTFLDFLKF